MRRIRCTSLATLGPVSPDRLERDRSAIRWRRALLAGLVQIAVWSCAREGASNPRFPNAPVVLISIDTLRSDRLPIYGHERGSTPAIDALRRDGILAARAYTHVPLTLPAHASLFTGLLPPDHGVRDNLGYPLRPNLPRLAKLLADAGYATGGAVSAAILRRASGIADGFAVWDEPGDGDGLAAAQAERAGPATLAAILPWLRSSANGPFFLFLHLYEPHAPHRPPAPFASRFQSAYDGEVAAADATVGELVAELRRLDAYDRAIVVLLSDHGEGLGDHGEQEHGVFLYREALQVPLVVKLPGSLLEGTTIEAPAQLVDVLPTVLGLTGVPAPAGLPGRSLLDLERGDRSSTTGGEAAAESRRLYAETYYPRLHFGWSELRSMIEGRLHFIDGPDPELYDLDADPAERAPVLDREPAAARTLRAALAAVPRTLEQPVAESPETRDRLASLGYLSGGSGAASSSSALPDPKSKLAVLASLERAIDAEARGDLDAAAVALRELVVAEPDSESARAALARVLERSGAAAERPPEHAAAIADRAALAEGAAAASAGDRDRAIALLRPLADRGDRAAMVALATTLSDGGRAAEARAWVERALEAGGGDAIAHETLGLLLLRAGDAAAAIEPLRRATTLDPSRANAWNLLGVALERGAGDHAAAIAAWQRALAIAPGRFDVLYNLATVAADAGQTELARSSFARFVAEAPPSAWAAELPRARERLRALEGGR